MKLEGHSSLRHLYPQPAERVLRGTRHNRITLDRCAKWTGRTQNGWEMGASFEESQELFPFRRRFLDLDSGNIHCNEERTGETLPLPYRDRSSCFATGLQTREGNHAHFDLCDV